MPKHLNPSSGPYTFTSHGSSYPVEVVRHFYDNHRIALVLFDASDGQRVCVATVNLPDVPLEANQAHIKTWGENETMLEFLTSNGIVRDLGIDVPAGYVHARLVELLDIPG